MIIRDLLVRIGIDAKTGPLTKALRGVQGFKAEIIALGAALGAVPIAITTFALRQAGAFEQSQIAFETILGSAEKAKVLLQDLTTFAAKTPFNLTGIIDSSKKLLAFGIEGEKIIDTMTNLGNIAAGVGREKLPSLILAFGKIRTKGKASMEELNILLEAGVPILDELAKGFGVTTQELFKLVTAGKVGFGDVDKALGNLATGNGKFANLMEKQSKSFFGLLSNVQDEIETVAREIGQELLPTAKELTKQFLAFLAANKDIIKAKISKFLSIVAKGAKLVFKGFVKLFSGVVNLIDIFDRFKFVLAAVGAQMLIIGGAKMLRNISRLGRIMRIVVIKNFRSLSKALSAVNLKLLLIPLTIALIAEDLLGFAQGRKSAFGVILSGFVALGNAISKFFLGVGFDLAKFFIGLEIDFNEFFDKQKAKFGDFLQISAILDEKGFAKGALEIGKKIATGEFSLGAKPGEIERITRGAEKRRAGVDRVKIDLLVNGLKVDPREAEAMFRSAFRTVIREAGFTLEPLEGAAP